MKRCNLLLYTSLFLGLFSCSTDNIPLYEDHTVNEDVLSSTSKLKVQASIQQLNVESRAVKLYDKFSVNDVMGVWTDELFNLPVSYNGESWDGDVPYLGSGKEVYAIMPYESNNHSKTEIPIDISKQVDYLWSIGETDNESGVKLSFKHMLTQVKVVIVNKGYSGKGFVNSISLHNVSGTAKFNLEEGKLKDFGNKKDIQIGGGYNMSDYISSYGIMMPDISESVDLIAIIDEKKYVCTLGNNYKWKPGFVYTYYLNLQDEETESDGALTFDDNNIDIAYWSTYGNDELLNIRKSNKETEWLIVSPSYTWQGSDIYKNKGAMFSIYFYPQWEENKTVDVRLVYLNQKGDVVSQTYSQQFTGNYKDAKDIFFFDYITLPADRYRIMPVFRFQGQTQWICPVGSGYHNTWYMDTGNYDIKDWPDTDWGYTVKTENNDLLMLRDIYIPSVYSPGAYQAGISISKDEEFKVDYILSNPTGKAISGELIYVDERGFTESSNCYRPCDKYDKYPCRSFKNELKRFHIQLSEGTYHYKGSFKARLSENSDSENYMTSVQHLYFKQDGSDEIYLLVKDWSPILNSIQKDPSNKQFWGANTTAVHVK